MPKTPPQSPPQSPPEVPSKPVSKPLPSLLYARLPATLWGTLAAVANGVFRVALVPILITPMFDRVLVAEDVSVLPGVLARALLIAFVGSLMLFAQDALLGRAAANVSRRWRERIYVALLQRDALPASSGGLTGRIVGDLRDVDIYYQFGLGTLLAETVASVMIVGLLLWQDWRTTLLLLVLALPLALILRSLGKRLEHTTSLSQDASEWVSSHLQEGFKHHATVRALDLHWFMFGRLHQDSTRAERLAERRTFLAALQIPVAQLLVFASLMSMIALLVARVSAGTLTTGEVVSYITLVALLSTPLQLLPKGYAMFKQASAAAVRLQALAVQDAADFPREPVNVSGAPNIALANLHFSYPEGMPVFDGLTLNLSGAGLVALRGASGCGKTTLLQLLLRFQQPNQGDVYLFDTPLANFPEHQLRKLVGYLPQESLLFHGTVRDNLTLGSGRSDSSLWEVLTRVQLADELRRQDMNLATQLGEDGSGLSGGQRQRLALARLLLRDPAILLLDEPSANLDDASEQAMLATLQHLAQSKLIVAVAHRPALIAAANIVVDVESGTLEHHTQTSLPPTSLQA